MRKALRRTIQIKEMNVKEEVKNKNVVVTFRIFQAVFLGIFTLGLSSIVGDITKVITDIISSFSTTTTIFGLMGAIITGILAKSSEEW